MASNSNEDSMVRVNPRSSVTNPNAARISKLKEVGEQEWMKPMYVLAAGLVAALFIGLVMYYQIATLFEEGEELHEAGWSATGGGILIILLVVLFVGAAAACFGMGWSNNGQAVIFTMGLAFLLSALFYFAFASIRDDKKTQFALWAILAVLAPIGLAVYSYMTMGKMAKEVEANPAEYTNQAVEGVKERKSWTMYTLVTTVVLGVVVGAGLYQIHGHVNEAV
jgi:ABC-type transport system involved in multi-copper enzyme maturation permease subunit